MVGGLLAMTALPGQDLKGAHVSYVHDYDKSFVTLFDLGTIFGIEVREHRMCNLGHLSTGKTPCSNGLKTLNPRTKKGIIFKNSSLLDCVADEFMVKAYREKYGVTVEITNYPILVDLWHKGKKLCANCPLDISKFTKEEFEERYNLVFPSFTRIRKDLVKGILNRCIKDKNGYYWHFRNG